MGPRRVLLMTALAAMALAAVSSYRWLSSVAWARAAG